MTGCVKHWNKLTNYIAMTSATLESETNKYIFLNSHRAGLSLLALLSTHGIMGRRFTDGGLLRYRK